MNDAGIRNCGAIFFDKIRAFSVMEWFFCCRNNRLPGLSNVSGFCKSGFSQIFGLYGWYVTSKRLFSQTHRDEDDKL